MFKQGVIHYPKDAKVLGEIEQDIAAFRHRLTIEYIESLGMTDDQIDMLMREMIENKKEREN